MAVAWNIFQPFLFGLIGAEVSVTSLRPETVGKIIDKLSSFHYWLQKNLYKEIIRKQTMANPQKIKQKHLSTKVLRSVCLLQGSVLLY